MCDLEVNKCIIFKFIFIFMKSTKSSFCDARVPRARQHLWQNPFSHYEKAEHTLRHVQKLYPSSTFPRQLSSHHLSLYLYGVVVLLDRHEQLYSLVEKKENSELIQLSRILS